MKLMLCSVYNVHYTLKPTSTYSGTLDTLKHQLNQVLRLYLGGAVGGVVYKIKDEFRKEVYVGTVDQHGAFKDLLHHSPDQNQSLRSEERRVGKEVRKW